MMGIGFWEMMLLAGIALVVIGPEKFPDFAKIVVRTVRDLRGYMDEVKKELSDELKPVEREMRSLTRAGSEQISQLRQTINNPATKTTAAAASPPKTTSDAQTQECKAEETPPDAANPTAGTTAYGAYSADTDQDYDHTIDETPDSEAPLPEESGEIADVRLPERLDG